MIWLILIYIITLILIGVQIYIDMDKGETLDHYFKNIDLCAIIFCILLPFINTIILIFLFIFKLLEKLWNKIKYWEK
jgi:hypothetical protein